jgi:hypothetical protein
MHSIKEQVSEYVEMLGETGMGIKSKKEVDLSQENAFTNAWSKLVLSSMFYVGV